MAIDETFPNYRQVISKNNTSCFTVTKTDLTECLTQAGNFSTEKYKGKKFFFTQNNLEIRSNNCEYGEYKGNVSVLDSYTPDLIENELWIGLNAQYILDYCKVLSPSALVSFTLKDELNQAVLTNNEHNEYIGIIMPMRL